MRAEVGGGKIQKIVSPIATASVSAGKISIEPDRSAAESRVKAGEIANF